MWLFSRIKFSVHCGSFQSFYWLRSDNGMLLKLEGQPVVICWSNFCSCLSSCVADWISESFV